MIAAQIEALAAVGDRPHEHRFLRPEVISGVGLGQFLLIVAGNGHEVENSRGEMADLATLLVRYVADHGQGFDQLVADGKHWI